MCVLVLFSCHLLCVGVCVCVCSSFFHVISCVCVCVCVCDRIKASFFM